MPATVTGTVVGTVVSPATSAGTVVVGPGVVVLLGVVVLVGTVVDVVEDVVVLVVEVLVVDEVLDVVVVVGVQFPGHWSAVVVSKGNRSGPCHGPVGAMVGGVTELDVPAIRSNCCGSQPLENVTVYVPLCCIVNGVRLTSVWGQATVALGMA
jgi:hypothetical protein